MEHGRDASHYSLLCFGGAGPVHAYGVAKILRSPALLSPTCAGVASALGFLVAPIATEITRSYVCRLDRIDWSRLSSLLDDMEHEGRRFLAHAGVRDADIFVSRSADMQYVGQMHDISVQIPNGPLTERDYETLRLAFLARYSDLFQRAANLSVEALNWRVTVSAPAPAHPGFARTFKAESGSALKNTRKAWFPETEDYVATNVFNRYRLRPGEELRGPAIIEERESTLVVGIDAQVLVDPYGMLIVKPPGL
jgi:N-methylhydantoinase A